MCTRRACLACRGVDVEVAAEGVAVTLIDFTLSRLVTADGATAFCDLEADPELFHGPKGDCQARACGHCVGKMKRFMQCPATHAYVPVRVGKADAAPGNIQRILEPLLSKELYLMGR